jgi:hypothetical protein
MVEASEARDQPELTDLRQRHGTARRPGCGGEDLGHQDGKRFLGSEARWCVFGAIFTRGRFFLSACKSERSLSRPVTERKINPPG